MQWCHLDIGAEQNPIVANQSETPVELLFDRNLTKALGRWRVQGTFDQQV